MAAIRSESARSLAPIGDEEWVKTGITLVSGISCGGVSAYSHVVIAVVVTVAVTVRESAETLVPVKLKRRKKKGRKEEKTKN